MSLIRYPNACVGSFALVLLAACGSGASSPAPTSSSSPVDASEKVVVTPSVAGTLTATSGATQTLNITFNASESGALSNLTVTGLDSLPAGWTASSAFNCATVSTGNGCVLNLTFTPTGAVSGKLQLGYSYTVAGKSQTGSIEIPYSSTANDNIVAATSPSGQVAAVVSSGSAPVAVTFNTDDGNTATALTVTSDLTALPGGWSSGGTTFTCASVATGNNCQLQLSYAPTVIGSGTLTLNYSYLDNSGAAKTGTVSIPYSATTNNNVTAAAAPTGTISASVGGSSQHVNLTFTTDDGNPATTLSVTTPLASLPAGWSSGSSSFACTSVTSGNGCQLALNFSPTAAVSGTLQIAYSYQSNAGVSKTGSASIAYTATVPRAYISDPNYRPLLCAINSDGTLNNCQFMTSAGYYANDLVFSGNYAYLSVYSGGVQSNGDIAICPVGSDGTLANCTEGGTNINQPTQVFARDNLLYVVNGGGSSAVTVCTIAPSDGSLSNCTLTGPSVAAQSITLVGNNAYVGAGSVSQSGSIYACSVDSTTGLLSNCATTGLSSSFFTTSANGFLYAPQAGNVGVCPIANNGTLSTCATSTVASGVTKISAVTPNGDKAYVIGQSAGGPPMFMPTFNVYLCSVSSSDGSLSGCTVTNGGQTNPWYWYHVVLH